MKQNNFRKIILGGAMFWGLASIKPVIAQIYPEANVLPEAIKNIKPSSEACMEKKASEAKPLEYTHVVEVEPDLSCAIAPEEAARQLQSPNTVLIDTRAATDFANFHIDGAMNLSVAELRSKTFLRGKPVVLIGNGKAERELYSDCRRLKSNGFKQVRVLRGGMPGWLVSGQPVLGQSPAVVQPARLTPSEFWIESRFLSNLVLVVADREAVQQQIKESVPIPDEKPKTIQSALEKHPKRSKSGPVAAVVLVTGKETDFQALSQAIKPVPLLVYSETADAFAHQLVQQASVWTALAQGPKQPSGCGR